MKVGALLLRASYILHFELTPMVLSMPLGPKISGVELAFLSALRREYSLNYALWRTGVIKF